MFDFDDTPAVPVALVHEPWAPVRVALTAGGTDPASIKDGDLLDGVQLAQGDRLVCVGTRPDAGIYTVGSVDSVRSTDANAAAAFKSGRTVRVIEGSVSNIGTWRLLVEGPVNLGVTDLTISSVVATATDLPAAAAFDNTPPGTLAL